MRRAGFVGQGCDGADCRPLVGGSARVQAVRVSDEVDVRVELVVFLAAVCKTALLQPMQWQDEASPAISEAYSWAQQKLECPKLEFDHLSNLRPGCLTARHGSDESMCRRDEQVLGKKRGAQLTWVDRIPLHTFGGAQVARKTDEVLARSGVKHANRLISGRGGL